MTETDNVVELNPPVADPVAAIDSGIWGTFECPDCEMSVSTGPGATVIEHLCYGEVIPEGSHIVQHPENGPHAVVERADGRYSKVSPKAATHPVAGA